MPSSPPVLVTGAAGFIGNALALRLLRDGRQVIGVDSINDYYDVRLKYARLARLEAFPGWRFVRLNLADRAAVAALFEKLAPPLVVHLAAQAGVRHSIDAPHDYVDANLVAFLNILEGCRHHGCEHLVYASSSSVYGANETMPFSTGQRTDSPISLYAATKKANETMAHAYAHIYGLPATGLRFFTVYGPWGRPDMAMFLFAEAMMRDQPIRLFNEGRMRRDFTYIDDAVEGVVRALDRPPEPKPGPPCRVLNVARGRSEDLGHTVALLEAALGIRAQVEHAPMQPGDVAATWADIADLDALAGPWPRLPIEDGVARFAAWYREVWLPFAKGDAAALVQA